MKQFQYTIKDELGVHARPAGLLVKLAKMRDRDLATAVQAAIAAGRKYVNCAGAILEPGKAD